MGKSPSYEEDEGLKRGPWTPEEDQKLVAYIQQHGHGSWRFLPEKAGLRRGGKSCRLRWTNYLRPDIKRGKFSSDEERTIIQLHALLGNRWSSIATHLPKRTDNEIKNYWNTHLKKRLALMGIDPVTHKPNRATLGSATADPKDFSNLSHMAQWERTRLEAEARLVRESKLNREPNDESALLSSEQILKKMPTTFGPPRWQAQLFTKSLQGNGFAPFSRFGEIIRSDQRQSDGSQTISANPNTVAAPAALDGRSSNSTGLDRMNSDAARADWNAEDHHQLGYHHYAYGDLIETSSDLNEMSKSTYWNDILNLVNCGPSNLPVF